MSGTIGPKLFAGLLTCAALGAAGKAAASPAAPVITVDRVLDRVAGWSIGYSDSLRACLAAAAYQDGTTIWLGFRTTTDAAFLAFTNARWRSIEVGQSYDIRLVTHGEGNWHGSFAGFDRSGIRGIFTSGLKDQFVSDLAEAGGLEVSLEGRRVATLSLVGSSDALAAVLRCRRDSTATQAAGEQNQGVQPSQTREAAGTGTETAESAAHAAQRDAEEQLKSERLAQARDAANRAIEDASTFVKTNGDDSQVLDHIQHMADLKAVLDGHEPAAVERSVAALSAGLSADAAYAAYAAQRDAERAREDARYLGDAVKTLTLQKGFLVHALIRDPTAAQAPEFLSLEKQADAVLKNPELERAKTVMGLIDTAIDKSGLRASYALAKANAETTAAPDKLVVHDGSGPQRSAPDTEPSAKLQPTSAPSTDGFGH